MSLSVVPDGYLGMLLRRHELASALQKVIGSKKQMTECLKDQAFFILVTLVTPLFPTCVPVSRWRKS